jgi:hypothetical protein
VLFVFGEHAREVITSEVGIWLARLLVDPNSSAYDWPELPAAFERAGINSSWRSTAPSAPSAAAAAAAGGSTAGPGSPGSSQQQWKAAIRSWVQELLQQLEVVIVPIEALDSRRLVEEGQLCVRKTASNVDLNRCVCVCVFIVWGKVGRRQFCGVPLAYAPSSRNLLSMSLNILHGHRAAAAAAAAALSEGCVKRLCTCACCPSAAHLCCRRNWPFAWKQESASEEQYGGPSPFSEPQSRLVGGLRRGRACS